MNARMPSWWLALLLIALPLWQGCATAVRSDVTVFHQWHGEPPLTYTIRPAAADETLEARAYRDIVRARLAALGFSEAPAATARYEVVVDPGVVARSEERLDYLDDPLYPRMRLHFGIGYGYPGYGRAFPALGYGFGLFHDPWLHPSWGWPVRRAVTIHRHQLRVEIFDRRAPAEQARVFEATAVSDATEERLPTLMPALADAVFRDFPGASGQTRTVRTVLDATGPVSAAPR